MASARRIPGALAAHPFELVVTLVAVDQASKLVASTATGTAAGRLAWLVPGFLAVGAGRSGSGPFGVEMLPAAAIALAALGVALAGWLTRSARRPGPRIGAGLLLAAALGNLVDRSLFGGPVVFGHVAAGGPPFWSGNLADLFGAAGIFLLARALLGGTGRGSDSVEVPRESTPELASEPRD